VSKAPSADAGCTPHRPLHQHLDVDGARMEARCAPPDRDPASGCGAVIGRATFDRRVGLASKALSAAQCAES
jgi:hypothetical protein